MSNALETAREMIGKQGSRHAIPTPALVVDLEALEKNIADMAAHCAKNGLSIRPHAKTHKCATIARKQIEAGAVGICCAKLGEAEALFEAGEGVIESILLTSPVVTQQGMERLIDLNACMPELIVAVDNAENVRALAAAAQEAIAAGEGKTLKCIVDLDIGLHRTGIAPGDDAFELAELVDAAETLELMGLQAYAGHLMHIEDFDERREKSLACMKVLGEMRDRLKAAGLPCGIVTGGGTGSYNIDPEAKVLTELQGGSYIFMAKQYNDVPIAGGAPMPFDTSLFVQMSVVSNNTKNLATTDAGFKAFSTDAEPPVLHAGAPEGAGYFFFGDEQGGILLPDGATLPLGATLTAVTPHCDPTVNLYDSYFVVKGDALVDIWPIEARGKSA